AETTPVSRPKQRLRPRATLYSPPPSQAVKVRAVDTRPSPGSRRSMISPRETRSKRQLVLGLIVMLMEHTCRMKGPTSRSPVVHRAVELAIDGKVGSFVRVLGGQCFVDVHAEPRFVAGVERPFGEAISVREDAVRLLRVPHVFLNSEVVN